MKIRILILLIFISLTACVPSGDSPNVFKSDWPENINRIWLGPEYWANRLQDWEILDGRIQCVISDWNRNVNLLTFYLGDNDGDFKMSVNLGLLEGQEPSSDKNWIGFRIGAKGQFNDYRDDAIYGKGIDAGITTSGDLFIGETPVKLNGNAQSMIPWLKNGIKLQIRAEKTEENYSIVLQALNPENEEILAEVEESDFTGNDLTGSLALVSHFPEIQNDRDHSSSWFKNWHISGSKIKSEKSRTYGPVLFAQYTYSRGILKMTAQLPPISGKDGQTVSFQVAKDNDWETIATATIDKLSRTATFRIEEWNNSIDQPYRLIYKLYCTKENLKEYYWEGTIRKEPFEKDEIIIAGFTGNNDLGFPNNDLVMAIKHHNPDLLFFSGDQIYEGVAGFGVQRSPVDKAILDYLRKWYLLGWAYGELMKNRPSVSLPDDHDVYHGNIWGEGGKSTGTEGNGSEQQDRGGYKMPPEWVKMVERTQTSHLPDPFDPTPVKQGIGVYYCEMNYGGISFAILEDRKFKSAPKHLLPEAEINNGWAQNRKWNAAEQADAPEAKLLGERQLKFLKNWSTDWSNKTWMKVVLSQTIFANVATLPKGEYHDRIVPKLRILTEGEYPEDDRPVSDMDSNGWPQTGRNNALKEMRKAFALHIAGDQHLGSTIQYGIEDWHDAGFVLCVPAISNVWPRRWFPSEPGANSEPGSPEYTGDFLDGFGNKISVYAVSNPVFTGKEPSNLYDRATGYGIVKFHRKTRDITIESWPRWTDPSQPDAKPYYGWPVTINQLDNYGRKAFGYLPAINVNGLTDPVIQLIDNTTEEIIYTIRINGSQFNPKVFREGSYSIKIGDPDLDKWKLMENLKIYKEPGSQVMEVIF